MARFLKRTRGLGLVEALVACLLLSLGMVLFARLQPHWRDEASFARQRTDAAHLAQSELEAVRREVDPRSSSRAATAGAQATRFRVARWVAESRRPGLREVRVEVAWTDRRAQARQLVLRTIVAMVDPAHSGALGLGRAAASAGGISRSPAIPVGAVDLGDGRSAFKPLENGRVAIIFDTRDGSVIGHCDQVTGKLSATELSSEGLSPCVWMGGRLLSGVVRFSLGTPPDAERASDPPLAFEMALALGRGKYLAQPICEVEPVASVARERHAAYHCVVFPRADGRWSGRLDLAPIGWELGTAVGSYRVCRYVSDLDASGAVDANLEHPALFEAVEGNLSHQNFLVISGPQACPTDPRIGSRTDSGLPFPGVATEPHQP